MIITIENGNLVVKLDGAKLRGYQIAQLEYYGYINVDGTYVKSSNNVEFELTRLQDFFSQENLNVDFSQSAKACIQSFNSVEEEHSKTLEIASDFKKGRFDHKAFSAFNKNLIKLLPRKLKSHQKKAAFHHYLLRNAANFSAPGSGKTSVVLAAYELFRIEIGINVLFVVGPPSCFGPWIREYKSTLGRDPKTSILSGLTANDRRQLYNTPVNELSELYLISYQSVANDLIELQYFFKREGIHTVMVVDEAHYMKQLDGMWSRAIMNLSTHVDVRFVLTGTPIPKNYKDVFNLFDFLWPVNNPFSEEEKYQIDTWEKAGKNEQAQHLLRKKLYPLFYRVRKKDLGLKAPKFHAPYKIAMNPVEKRLYEAIKSKIHELAKSDLNNNQELIFKLWKGRMIRLRQALSYSKLLTSAIEGYEEVITKDTEIAQLILKYDTSEVPAKINKLKDISSPLLKRGKKIVIWANFVGTLKLIKKQYLVEGVNAEIIYGQTPVRVSNERKSIIAERTREDIIEEFLNESSTLNILIANPAACAESISLHTTCKHAIYYDLSYNCAQYLQSLDRIHRIGGSEKEVSNYYFLQYENTIDEDIKRNLDKKAKKMYDIIDQDCTIYSLDMLDDSDEIEAYKKIFNA